MVQAAITARASAQAPWRGRSCRAAPRRSSIYGPGRRHASAAASLHQVRSATRNCQSERTPREIAVSERPDRRPMYTDRLKTDEDESTDPGIIVAERAILKFVGDREADAPKSFKAPGGNCGNGQRRSVRTLP